jgi:16S rRNA C967 or C1407 C5-methylase (RsmB/RsmF family)/NOL1/NOP2/fmu family ribosome biogenesis protein
LSLQTFNLTPVPWCPTGFYYDPETRPGLHPYHAAGAYYLQEPSAMAPAELLDPQPGERVLDLCAAPGGKTTQIAGKLAGEGLLVCNEIHPKRAGILASNVERLGIANARVLNEHPAKLAERFPDYFDRVLVDAPCSGEGMFRKHDAAFEDWSPETVAMCARRQAEILDSAAAMLRPGGRLVYSTCTFSPEENEGSVAGFLSRHPEFEVAEARADVGILRDSKEFGPYGAPGHPEWADGNPALAKTIRLWPHKLRGEGHFAAVLIKKAVGGGAFDAPNPSNTHTGGPSRAPAPTNSNPAALPKPVVQLLKDLGIDLPDGVPVVFGDRVFWAPTELPDLRGLKVLRPGLELAELRRDLAVPAHALALWAKTAASVHAFAADDPACAAWLRGETIPTEAEGWTLVTVDGLSLGWGKGVRGTLKNHYPKGLRISSLQT